MIYWLYVVSLPVGPVWILQGFFTLATGLMLIGYLHYKKGWGLSIAVRKTNLKGAAGAKTEIDL